MKLPQVPAPPLPGGAPQNFAPGALSGAAQQTQAMGMPVGSIIAYAGKILEETGDTGSNLTDLQHFGWKVCDGSTLHIDQFPDLYDALGELYGPVKDGTFYLPTYIGQFLRGIDPDAASPANEQRAQPTGSKGGTATGVGAVQKYATLDHTHKYDQAKISGTALADPGTPAVTSSWRTLKPVSSPTRRTMSVQKKSDRSTSTSTG